MPTAESNAITADSKRGSNPCLRAQTGPNRLDRRRDHALILYIRRAPLANCRPAAEPHLWIVDAFGQLAEII